LCLWIAASGRDRVGKFITFLEGVTIAWLETNGQVSILMSRDGVPVVLAMVDASAQAW
jgi:RNA polymerase sigma-70 factor (ECF subfamily)